MSKHTTPEDSVNPSAATPFCDFYHEHPDDGSDWMIALGGDGPTADEVRELLQGVVAELEIIDPGGIDATDVEVVEPLRGHDCAIHVRSGYATIACVLLGIVLKRLMDAGYSCHHTAYWPDVPKEITDARDRIAMEEAKAAPVPA